MWRAIVIVAVLSGCWQSSPPGQAPGGGGSVKVTSITLGRTLAPDDSIVAEAQTNSFWTTDIFYVSVATEGSASNVALKARFTSQDGKVVGESTKTISPSGPTLTAFQAASPDRWTAGDYKVEIFVDGVSAGSKDLTAR